MKTFNNYQEYREQFPENIRIRLDEFRELVLRGVPKGEEVIAYGMPAIRLNGPLLYFGAFKEHLGFYPMPQTIQEFAKELTGLKTSKGAIQFPHDAALPKKLITAMIKYRVAIQQEKKTKPAKKKPNH